MFASDVGCVTTGSSSFLTLDSTQAFPFISHPALLLHLRLPRPLHLLAPLFPLFPPVELLSASTHFWFVHLHLESRRQNFLFEYMEQVPMFAGGVADVLGGAVVVGGATVLVGERDVVVGGATVVVGGASVVAGVSRIVLHGDPDFPRVMPTVIEFGVLAFPLIFVQAAICKVFPEPSKLSTLKIFPFGSNPFSSTIVFPGSECAIVISFFKTSVPALNSEA